MFLIVYKWAVDWAAVSKNPPNLLGFSGSLFLSQRAWLTVSFSNTNLYGPVAWQCRHRQPALCWSSLRPDRPAHARRHLCSLDALRRLEARV